jgi:hypothetical protein
MKAPDVDIAARTDRGKRRETNEDAYLVFRSGRFLKRIQSNIPEEDLDSRYDEAGHVMAVADGMGAAELVSRRAAAPWWKPPCGSSSVPQSGCSISTIRSRERTTSGVLRSDQALFRGDARRPAAEKRRRSGKWRAWGPR